MKQKLTEHSHKLKIKTSTEWQKEKCYKFQAWITDKETAEKAKTIPNKAQFVIDCIKEKFGTT